MPRPAPVRSLRQGTRAEAIRVARTCYDHLAGRLGTALMAALLDRGLLAGGDGTFRPNAGADRLSATGRDIAYRLTDVGRTELAALGIDLTPPRYRPLIRYCVDWSEQRHHLAGALAARLLDRMIDLRWVQRTAGTRAVRLTEAGRTGLVATFGMTAPLN